MCDCDKKKKESSKYAIGGTSNSGNGGNGESLCNNVKFTLLVTLHFSNKKSKKFETTFLSKSHSSICNHPNSKNFDKAYTKIITKYKKSLPKETSPPKIENITTQVTCQTNLTSCSQCQCNIYDTKCGVKSGKGIDCCGSNGNKCTCYYNYN